VLGASGEGRAQQKERKRTEQDSAGNFHAMRRRFREFARRDSSHRSRSNHLCVTYLFHPSTSLAWDLFISGHDFAARTKMREDDDLSDSTNPLFCNKGMASARPQMEQNECWALAPVG
jgi:hypothetical protein